MRQVLTITILIFTTLAGQAQSEKKDNTSDLLKKGNYYLSVRTNGFGLGISDRGIFPAGRNYFAGGYFFFDRLSADLELKGLGISSRTPSGSRVYFNSDLTLNYFFYARNNFLLNASAGISYLTPQMGASQKFKDLSSAKIGMGVSWRIPKLPALALTLNASTYLNPATLTPRSVLPKLTFGVSFYFNAKKKKVIRDLY